MWEIRNLSKRYGQVQAVKQVSFELKTGETAAVLGESGCGKSGILLWYFRSLPCGII